MSQTQEFDAEGRKEATIARLREVNADLLAALHVVLDQCDYTAGNCGPTEMVAAVLDEQVIKLARAAIAKATQT